MDLPSGKQTRTGARLRVLFVEDNKADLELCRRELARAGYVLSSDATDRREEFERLLSHNSYDLVIADFRLPDWDGLEALRLLQDHDKEIPFVLVTGALGDETAVECIKAGASDYVLKDRLSRLPHAVAMALGERELRRERAHVEAELKRSNAELQDFAFIASHDLQEPLRKVVAFGNLLESTAAANLDERSRDYLSRMQNAAQRMIRLLNGLLEYSRLGTRARPFAAVDLTQVLFEAVADLEERIRETAARVEATPLPLVWADHIQMRQLFLNLLANALKFQRPGVPPRVSVSSDLNGNGQWEICVHDNGIGFPEDCREKIFRPFNRLHCETEFPGTGMGLAICRRVVYRHGGSIEAHGTPDAGSTFVVRLPTLEAAATTSLPEDVAMSGADTESRPLVAAAGVGSK